MKKKSNQTPPESDAPALPAKESGTANETTGQKTPRARLTNRHLSAAEAVKKYGSGSMIFLGNTKILSGKPSDSTPPDPQRGQDQGAQKTSGPVAQEQSNKGNDMKENLKQITQEQFNDALAAYQAAKPSGFSGPFINSAPAGNMFSDPFSEWAWVLGTETVLLKTQGGPTDGWKFFSK